MFNYKLFSCFFLVLLAVGLNWTSARAASFNVDGPPPIGLSVNASFNGHVVPPLEG